MNKKLKTASLPDMTWTDTNRAEVFLNSEIHRQTDGARVGTISFTTGRWHVGAYIDQECCTSACNMFDDPAQAIDWVLKTTRVTDPTLTDKSLIYVLHQLYRILYRQGHVLLLELAAPGDQNSFCIAVPNTPGQPYWFRYRSAVQCVPDYCNVPDGRWRICDDGARDRLYKNKTNALRQMHKLVDQMAAGHGLARS